MLEKEFFKKDTISLAKDLLGKVFVRKIDGKLIIRDSTR